MATYSTTFDDPAEDPLSEGGVWQDGPGAFGGVQKSGGKESNSAATQSTCTRCNSAAFGSDQYSEANLSDTSGSKYPGVFTRIQSSTDGDSYYLEIDPGGNLTMYRVDDTGTLGFTQLGATFGITISVPDDVRLESTGSTHEVFWNGASQGTRSDATYANGKPGFGAYSTAADDPSFTSWSGGDLGGGSSLTLEISDAITFTDAITKSVGAAQTDALSFADAISKSVGASQSDAIVFADAIGKGVSKASSDAISFSDSSATSSGKNIADAVAFADAESNGTGKAATDALTFVDTRTASTGKSTTDTISFTDTLTIPGYVTDTITFGDSLTTSFVAGASCPPDKYLRKPLGFITSSGERSAFAEIANDQNKRKAIGFITNDGTGRCGFAPE